MRRDGSQPLQRLHLRVWLVVLFGLMPNGVRGESWRAGTSKVDITPPVGVPLWGYAVRRDKPATGVRESLFARVVVLQAGKERLAVCALDLGRPPAREVVARIEKRIEEKLGKTHLFLSASHTHHGPILEVPDWPDAKKPYTADLETKLAEAIIAAGRDLQPVRLGCAACAVPFNRNRHSRKPEAPVDRELVVLRLDDAQGRPVAHLVNFAAHPTMLPARLLEFSPDYPGALAREVEKEGGLCLFLQGASGDLSPAALPQQEAEAFGAMVGRKVLETSRGLKTELVPAARLDTAAKTFRFESRVDLSNPLVRGLYAMAFFPKLIAHYEREYRDGIAPRLSVALLDRRIGLVGVSGEFFCDHARRLKERAGLEHLLFLGYCNGYHQYFPTIEAAAEGGYGADLRVAPVEVGAGERMMDQALIELYRLRGKFRN